MYIVVNFLRINIQYYERLQIVYVDIYKLRFQWGFLGNEIENVSN